MRIRPEVSSLVLHEGRAELKAEFDLHGVIEPRVVVDIYSLIQVHPDRHLGWWQAKPKGPRMRLRIALDLSRLSPDSLTLWRESEQVPLDACWVNEGYVLEPVQDLQLVLRNGRDEIVEIAHVALKELRREVLHAYAARAHASQAYAPPNLPLTFVQTFHSYRLERLGALFSRYLRPGSRVLDVASGHSLFTEPAMQEKLRSRWRYELVCCDAAAAVMAERGRSFPWHGWVMSDAAELPFADAGFDAVFAGEIIEHLPDPMQALGEWRRVLRPSGLLVLTTPNRLRLSNRANRSEFPMGPDHVNELTHGEVRSLLRSAGFAVIHCEGVYLETALSWWQRGGKRDLLQHALNRPRLSPLMRLLMHLGRPFPAYAWDLIFLARKR